jgi:hypothetical protein
MDRLLITVHVRVPLADRDAQAFLVIPAASRDAFHIALEPAQVDTALCDADSTGLVWSLTVLITKIDVDEGIWVVK